MVNITLGNEGVGDCRAGDANGDGQITINEVIAAVNNALTGCQPAAPVVSLGTAAGLPGETVDVAIALTSNGRPVVSIAALVFEFDADALTVASCASAVPGKNADTETPAAGRVFASLSGGLGIIPDGTVLRCTLQINDRASSRVYALHLTSAVLLDDTFNNLTATGIEGSVTVTGLTETPTATSTQVSTPTATETATRTPTAINTPTATPTSTNTPTATGTPSGTATQTPTGTNTPTATLTTTSTPTVTQTPSQALTPTIVILDFGLVSGGGPGGTTTLPFTLSADNIVGIALDVCFDSVFVPLDMQPCSGPGVIVNSQPAGSCLLIDVSGVGDQPLPTGDFMNCSFNVSPRASLRCDYHVEFTASLNDAGGHVLTGSATGTMTVFQNFGGSCSKDCVCPSGFCRDSVCCTDDCADGSCNLPGMEGTCVPFTPTPTPSPRPRFVDNGDGTITDTQTGLMWEKKSDDGSIHDKDNRYTWSTGTNNPDGTAFTVFLAQLNDRCADGTTDCTAVGDVACLGIGNGKCGFAGHRDWQLPSEDGLNPPSGPKDLESILDAGVSGCGTGGPCVDAVFNNGACVGQPSPSSTGCTVTTCSCTATQADFYWSSTSNAGNPVGAWYVFFIDGLVGFDFKTNSGYVRAVRRRFVDNGDGTITDTQTGLMWEKKSDDGSIHDKDNRYTWAGLCGCSTGSCTGNEPLCQPNAAAASACAAQTAQTGGSEGCAECAGETCNIDPYGWGAQDTIWDWRGQLNAASFAGHSDWRIPSAGGEFGQLAVLSELASSGFPKTTSFSTPTKPDSTQLASIVDTGAAGCDNRGFCVDPAFSNGVCASEPSPSSTGCTVTTCSCTVGNDVYWSSDTGDPGSAYIVQFNRGFGYVAQGSKAAGLFSKACG